MLADPSDDRSTVLPRPRQGSAPADAPVLPDLDNIFPLPGLRRLSELPASALGTHLRGHADPRRRGWPTTRHPTADCGQAEIAAHTTPVTATELSCRATPAPWPRSTPHGAAGRHVACSPGRAPPALRQAPGLYGTAAPAHARLGEHPQSQRAGGPPGDVGGRHKPHDQPSRTAGCRPAVRELRQALSAPPIQSPRQPGGGPRLPRSLQPRSPVVPRGSDGTGSPWVAVEEQHPTQGTFRA